MPHAWQYVQDGADAARTVKTTYDAAGSLPAELVSAYRALLKSARPAIVAEFFQTLAKECPEALKYFNEKP